MLASKDFTEAKKWLHVRPGILTIVTQKTNCGVNSFHFLEITLFRRTANWDKRSINFKLQVSRHFNITIVLNYRLRKIYHTQSLQIPVRLQTTCGVLLIRKNFVLGIVEAVKDKDDSLWYLPNGSQDLDYTHATTLPPPTPHSHTHTHTKYFKTGPKWSG